MIHGSYLLKLAVFYPEKLIKYLVSLLVYFSGYKSDSKIVPLRIPIFKLQCTTGVLFPVAK